MDEDPFTRITVWRRWLPYAWAALPVLAMLLVVAVYFPCRAILIQGGRLAAVPNLHPHNLGPRWEQAPADAVQVQIIRPKSGPAAAEGPAAAGSTTEATVVDNADAARTLWFAATVVHLLALVGATVFGGWCFGLLLGEFRGGTPWHRHPRARLALFVAALLAVLVLILACLSLDYDPGGFLEGTLTADRGIRITEISRLISAMHRSASGVAFALALVGGLTLVPTEARRRLTPAQLAKRLWILQSLLYTGMTVLVAAMLQMQMLYRWGLAYVTPTDGAYYKSVENFALASATAQGLYYTLLLAASYALTAAGLRYQVARWAAEEARTPAERAAWLQEQDLAASPWEKLPHLAAILSPFLAGLLGDLFKSLGK